MSSPVMSLSQYFTSFVKQHRMNMTLKRVRNGSESVLSYARPISSYELLTSDENVLSCSTGAAHMRGKQVRSSYDSHIHLLIYINCKVVFGCCAQLVVWKCWW